MYHLNCKEEVFKLPSGRVPPLHELKADEVTHVIVQRDLPVQADRLANCLSNFIPDHNTSDLDQSEVFTWFQGLGYGYDIPLTVKTSEDLSFNEKDLSLTKKVVSYELIDTDFRHEYA